VSILTILVVFVVVGTLLWLINAYVPMQPGVKRLMNIAVVCLLVLWLLRASGLLAGLGSVRI
jgi:hypothetical protein